jgi:ribonucleoside-diphosphate reductase alpha chain
VIAPTGTIGLVMDCDTTGIEPDFALVKFKKLAGGGYFKIINQSVPGSAAHARLSRTRSPRSSPMPSATARWPGAPASTTTALKAKGFPTRSSDRGGAPPRLRHQVRLQQVDAGRGVLPRRHLGIPAAKLDDPGLRPAAPPRLHQAPRSTPPTIHVCGAMTLEGAPHLKAEHCRCSTAPIPAARSASAICRSTATSA